MSARTQLANLRKILIAEDYRKFALLIVAMFIAALLQVVGVASILPFMELVARPDAIDKVPLLRWAYDTFGFDSERQMLLWAGAGVFTLFTLSILVTLYVGWFIDRTSWATVHRLCVSQLSVYLQLPYEFFLRTNTANLLQRVVAEINLLLSDVLLAGCQLFAQSILAIGMLIVMSTVNATLTAISLVVFGGLYLCIHLIRHTFIVRLSAERIEKDNQRYTSFIETITGLKAIRSSNASAFFLQRFSAASGRYARIHPFFNLAISVPRYLMEVIAFGGILIAVLYMVSAGGDFAAALPEIALFAVAFYRLTPALHGVFESAARLSKGLPTVEAVTRDLHPEEDLEPFSDQMPPSELGFAEQVALVGVTHQYQGTSTPVLTQIDAAISKGECVAFVGQTGSGKTTLIDLIVGLLRPTAGHIAVDGVPLISNAIAQWRRNVAYVPQDVFLYDSTIADNIVFGPGRPDPSRMRWAARVAGLETFIEKELEKGYDTEVGERGTRLSGGQRQGVGIARAIYRMPQLLVLDEATSALDGVTEQAVLTEIRRELPDVTIVMVTHRLSTTRACDRIFLLNQGRLDRVGTFDKLYGESSLFRAIATTGTEGDGSTVQDQPEAVR